MTDPTPGPWGVEHAPDALPGRVRSVVGQSVAAPHFAGLDDDTIRANARLIAAAPELLEALCGLVEDVTHEDHEPHDWSEHVCVKAARAVIAKARGTGT